MKNKGSFGNFFEDFEVGSRFLCPTPRVLSNADRVAYIAFTGDRSPLYCSSTNLIHPLIVFHTVLGQTVRQISLNAVANLGYAELVWHSDVFSGDEISTEVEVVGLKENSNGESGIVYVRTTGLNQRSEPVLTFHRWVMVRKRSKTPTPFLGTPIIPHLNGAVPVDTLSRMKGERTPSARSGGDFFFEDYAIGEEIDHGDGMTVNPSDHMSFTRLYQNSARVHFDALATMGRPLVYGGLVLSIGYALAFNGLEQRLGIRAINGGSHANPVYAGDTLYCLTRVLDARNLGSAVGALRLQLLVVKNEKPATGFQHRVVNPQSQQQHYHPGVVLDLDYWEIMPGRNPDAS